VRPRRDSAAEATQPVSAPRIAIVGLGPRGLVALERLIEQLAEREDDPAVEIVLFEASQYPGCGPNYAPDQPQSNQLNMPFREIPMATRKSVDGAPGFGRFKSFTDWYQDRFDVVSREQDHFPPRAEIGRYLQARLESILEFNADSSTVRLNSVEVSDIAAASRRWALTTRPSVSEAPFDEVLLSIGHQSATPDDALERWRQHGTLFEDPYPSESIIQSAEIDADTVVALRGLGLSMIDVVKSLTLGRGGQFVSQDPSRGTLAYRRSGREPKTMLPFSLDGQPVAPKPLNAGLDERFKPDEEMMSSADEALLSAAPACRGDELKMLLVDIVSSAASAVFARCSTPRSRSGVPAGQSAAAWRELARQWLLDPETADPVIVDRTACAVTLLQTFMDMATDHEEPGLDYCIGQVWRHFQPTFYARLRFLDVDGEAMHAAMALDQRMKRYAFGPPVEAVAMLLALHDAGLLKFKVVDDPDIELVDSGWRLHDGESSITAQVMIDTVLDPPRLRATCTPLVKCLKTQDIVKVVHEDLGARARQDGQLLIDSGPVGGMAAAGRLIVGTVFEGDALICCFGEELNDWARGVVERQFAIAG